MLHMSFLQDMQTRIDALQSQLTHLKFLDKERTKMLMDLRTRALNGGPVKEQRTRIGQLSKIGSNFSHAQNVILVHFLLSQASPAVFL